MLAFLRRNPMLAFLAAVALALLVIIGIETGWGSRFRSPVPSGASKPPAPVEAKVLPTLVATAPEQAYPETVARPLFTPTRRPAPTAPVVAAPNIPRGMFTLHGVTIAGDTRIAMLREKSSGKVHRVEVGREVNGAKVASIDPERVVLRLGDENEEVVMTVQKAGAGGSTPPASVASASAGPFPAASAGSVVPGAGMPGAVPPGVPPTARAANGRPPVPGSTTAQAGAPGAPTPGPIAPQGAQTPQATTTPMTPEELLARRRARRAQQQQQP
jgi:hypothetical protein